MRFFRLYIVCQLEKTIIDVFADEILSSAFWRLTLRAPETKIAKFANSVDLEEVTHHEPPDLALHCFPSSF